MVKPGAVTLPSVDQRKVPPALIATPEGPLVPVYLICEPPTVGVRYTLSKVDSVLNSVEETVMAAFAVAMQLSELPYEPTPSVMQAPLDDSVQ